MSASTTDLLNLLHERLPWLDPADSQPLHGLRVLNTRARADGEELSHALRELGAQPISLPAIHIAEPDDLAPLNAAITAITSALPNTPAYDWIGFTSAHAVAAFIDRLEAAASTQIAAGSAPDAPAQQHHAAARALAGIKLAAVGPATAAALSTYGLTADLVPDRAAGRHLAAALGDVSGLRILLPRSEVALADLPEALRARGALVTEVVAYATRPAPADQRTLENVLAGRFDAALFFSPSALNGFASQVGPRRLDEVLRGSGVICVGETTARAARAQGLADAQAAPEPTTAGVIEALMTWRHKSGRDAQTTRPKRDQD